MGTLNGFGVGKPKSNTLDLCFTDPITSMKSPYNNLPPRSEEAIHAFKAAAYAGIMWNAKHKALFTTDEVWEYLEQFHSNRTPEPRVMGSVMIAAKQDGMISPTHIYRHSTRRKVNHGRMVKIWQSHIYEKELK